MKLNKILDERTYQFLTKTFISPSIKKIVKRIRNNEVKLDAKNVIALLFSKEAKYIKPWQNVPEILQLAEMIAKKKPKVAVEIGTAAGGTLFITACLAADDALIVSIDLPRGMYGGGYPEWKIPLYESFARKSQKIELIRGDSHSTKTHTQLKAILNGRKIDYLFIDGDHTYEGVSADFYSYGALMSEDGIIAFHDIVSDKSAVPDHFVSVFWNEIKGDYQHFEFVEDPKQSKLGLGVLQLNGPVKLPN